MQTMPTPLMTTRLKLMTAAVALALGGCAVTPTPLTQQETAARVQTDRAAMFKDQEAVSGPIGFHEAAARALKYNLDYRLKLMESALAQGLHDVSAWDMMPKLLAGAGYLTRNNESGGRSIGIEDRVESLRPSTSSERNRTVANLGLSWNVLDFGLSYFRSRQQANQYLIAEERRRKVAQTVMQDVRNAYWRAAGAQRLLPQVDALLAKSNQALNRARQIETQGLLPQPQVLGYQRALLDATTILQLRRTDLELAKEELAALMNLAPGTVFRLADEQTPNLPAVPSNVQQLENLALAQRPELREEDYRKRVTADDARRAITSLLPGISLDYGWQYDSNKYLYNRDWTEGGVRLSFNVLRLLALPAINRANNAAINADDTRRAALSMAVISQTHLATQRYGLALADLKQAEEGARVDQRLLNYARSAQQSKVDAELETIRSEARAVLSEYQRFIAYSNAQSAWGRLYNSVGLDVLPAEIEKNDVKTLATAISRTMADWERQTFQFPAKPSAQSVPVELVIENIADAAVAERSRVGIVAALKRYNVRVVDAGTAPIKLVASLELAATSHGTRRAVWDIRSVRKDGVVNAKASFASVLGQDLTDASIDALAQSLIDANALDLASWLDTRAPQVAGAREQK